MDPLSARRPPRRVAAPAAGAWVRLACARAAGRSLPEAATPADDPYAARRRAMVADIREDTADGTRLGPRRARGDGDGAHGIASFPRRSCAHAYENRPLPIGHGQTISQPYIVALMTTLAQPRRGDIACSRSAPAPATRPRCWRELAGQRVHDRDHRTARRRRRRSACARSATTTCTRASATATTAGRRPRRSTPSSSPRPPASVPPPLIAQLKPGGRMVIPVGSSFFTQTLMLVEKDARRPRAHATDPAGAVRAADRRDTESSAAPCRACARCGSPSRSRWSRRRRWPTSCC